MGEVTEQEIRDALDGLMTDSKAATILGEAYCALRAALTEREGQVAALREEAGRLREALKHQRDLWAIAHAAATPAPAGEREAERGA